MKDDHALRSVDHPLGPVQEMFVGFESLRPGAFLGPGFLLRAGFWMDGPLDVQRLRRAVRAVVDRHQALRTAVVMGEEGSHVQRVFEPGTDAGGMEPVVCEPVEGEPREGAARRAALVEALGRAAARGIDPSTGAPLRVVLASATPTQHALMLIMHHMVGDAVSTVLVARDIAAAYNDPDAYRRLPAAEQYVDHLQRQAEVRDAQRARNMEYWTQKLRGLQTLHLPHDRPKEGRSGGVTEVVTRDLPETALQAVAAAAASSRSTRGIVFQAGFFCLLAARTGARDLFIPTAFLGRVKPGSETVIGPFVQGLVLRADLAGDPSFEEILRRVRTSTLEAYDHLNLPIMTILGAVPEAAAILADPKYILMYIQVQPQAGASDLAFDGVTVEPFDHDEIWFSAESSPLTEDLTITLHERGPSVRLVTRYDATLFDRKTIEDMIDDYVELLGRGGKDLATRLSDLVRGLGHGREPDADRA